jgi:hypothetical protein
MLTDVGFVALFEGPLTAGSGGLLTPDDALLRLEAEDKASVGSTAASAARSRRAT